jgi:hypothetical protein
VVGGYKCSALVSVVIIICANSPRWAIKPLSILSVKLGTLHLVAAQSEDILCWRWRGIKFTMKVLVLITGVAVGNGVGASRGLSTRGSVVLAVR